MRCLTGSEIDRYVSGTMEEVVSEGVTKHLLACPKCRLAVSEARGNQGGVNTDQRTLDMEPEPPPQERGLVRIECEACGARYGIPSDRIKGRVIKIRCKKCNDLIRVVNKDVKTEPLARRGEGKVWFTVVRRKRIGPFSEQEIRQQVEEGTIKLRTYTWRQGYEKWERLAKIPEFVDLADGRATNQHHMELFDEPTRQAPAGVVASLMAESEPTADSAVQTAYRPALAPSDSNVRTAYRPAGDDSEEGLQTAYLPADGAADSAVQTAYRPAQDVSESKQVTSYLPGDDLDDTDPGQAPADDGLTAIHYKESDPLAGLEAEEPDDELAAIFDAQPEREQVTEDHHRGGVVPDRDPYVYPDDSAMEQHPEQQPRPEPELEQPEPPEAWDRAMRGQRREESVLFSLKHLQNLADVKPEQRAQIRADHESPSLREDNSALFDIKPLVAAGAAAAPLVMTPPPREGRRIGLGMVFLVGLLGIMVGAALVLALVLAAQPQLLALVLDGKQASHAATDTTEESDEPGTSEKQASAGVTPETEPAEKVAATPESKEDLPEASADAATVARAAGPDAGVALAPDLEVAAPSAPVKVAVRSARTPARRRVRGRRRSRPAARPAVAALPAAAPRSKPAPVKEEPDIAVVDPDKQMDPMAEADRPARPAPAPAPAKKKKADDDELDALIAAAEGSKVTPKKKKAAPPPAASAAPKGLTRSQVSRGMRMANHGASGCRRRFQQVGVVTVRATIGNAGRVTRATALGSFAGTPVGECVLASVRSSCRFPAFSGPPVTVKYPFVLR